MPWESRRHRAQTRIPASLPGCCRRLPIPALPQQALGGLTAFTSGILQMRGISGCRAVLGYLGAGRNLRGEGEGGCDLTRKAAAYSARPLWAVLKHCCGCNDSGWRTFRSQMSLCEQKAALDLDCLGPSVSFFSFLAPALKGAGL